MQIPSEQCNDNQFDYLQIVFTLFIVLYIDVSVIQSRLSRPQVNKSM